MIPVPQSVIRHDTPMMLHIPTSVITDVCERMPGMIHERENEEITPDELEEILTKCKVTPKQQEIFSSWFWAHPTTRELLQVRKMMNLYRI